MATDQFLYAHVEHNNNTDNTVNNDRDNLLAAGAVPAGCRPERCGTGVRPPPALEPDNPDVPALLHPITACCRRTKSFLQSLPPLPTDLVGVPIEYDFSDTLGQVLHWHPRAWRLVVVTGAAAPDREFEARLHIDAARFQDRITVEFLAGLPTGELLKWLSELGKFLCPFSQWSRCRAGAMIVSATRRLVSQSLWGATMVAERRRF